MLRDLLSRQLSRDLFFFFFKDSISQIKLFQIKHSFRTIRHKGNFFSHTLNRDLKEKLAHFFAI